MSERIRELERRLEADPHDGTAVHRLAIERGRRGLRGVAALEVALKMLEDLGEVERATLAFAFRDGEVFVIRSQAGDAGGAVPARLEGPDPERPELQVLDPERVSA